MAGEEEEILTQNEENQILEDSTPNETGDNSAPDRLIKLPLTRVKNIMKSDPDVTLASQDAVVALAKATELFIQLISKDASGSTMQGKRKTLQRKDLDNVMDRRDCYLFLDGAID
ncbi:DNA polymerase epsilon subunit 4-like [Mercenaria mercenaria]|uniref:DNA polymerase epsilon subunit 4-like n=1 Tax=Mercenaria mercenaria TaxID=6596 RepID=UPI00234E7691|nr:DNA polymerase epsilon subunit 4-like [Mercenaria mercenaria]